MRPVAERPVEIRGRQLGGERPLHCVPLVGETPEALRGETEEALRLAPDLVEVRVDAWRDGEEVPAALARLRWLRGALGDLPLLLSCRHRAEGGIRVLSDEARGAVYGAALEERLADLVDLELRSDPELLGAVRDRARRCGVPLLLSSHDFQGTPPEGVLVSLFEAALAEGADVAKVAVTPRRPEDLLRLLSALLAVRRAHPEPPLVGIAMGPLGAVTRVAGGLFGSDLAFAVGTRPSAPGQIPLEELRRIEGILIPRG
jgi:3-dehydroquinate dehydratase-1